MSLAWSCCRFGSIGEHVYDLCGSSNVALPSLRIDVALSPEIAQVSGIGSICLRLFSPRRLNVITEHIGPVLCETHCIRELARTTHLAPVAQGRQHYQYR